MNKKSTHTLYTDCAYRVKFSCPNALRSFQDDPSMSTDTFIGNFGSARIIQMGFDDCFPVIHCSLLLFNKGRRKKTRDRYTLKENLSIYRSGHPLQFEGNKKKTVRRRTERNLQITIQFTGVDQVFMEKVSNVSRMADLEFSFQLFLILLFGETN